MTYFTSEKVTDRITRIQDILGTCLYLVEGDERACLLDTGDGFGNLGEYVKTLTDKPVFVVLTHGHLDHVGGACFFDEVYMNPKDDVVYDEHSTVEFRYHKNQAKWPAVADIPMEEYNPPYEGEKKELYDGQVFDLGNCHIEMIEVPGHTQGMTCALIQEERYIVFGDACGVFVLLYNEQSSTVSEYKKSLERLKTYEDRYDHIIRNHGTFQSPKELLDNVIECCDSILDGTADNVEIDFSGERLLLCKAVDEHNRRLDGKEGNIAYKREKAV